MEKTIKFFKDCFWNKKIEIILLGFLILFWVTNNFFWITSDPLNNLLCGKDWQTHIRNYSTLLNLFQHGSSFSNINHSAIYNYLFIDFDYPPVYYWVSLLLNLVIGYSVQSSALFTSTFFLIILIVFTYKIGEWLRPGSGLLAAFICSFLPVIHRSSLFYNLELATGAGVAMCIYFIIKTEMFKNGGYSILAGIFLGIGMLIKYTFAFFLIGPLLAFLINIYSGLSGNKGTKQQKKISYFV